MLYFNLPLGVLAHAGFLTFLGLYLSLFSQNPHAAPLGVSTLGIGLCYLSTAYVPKEQNLILYASVPVRLFLATVAAAKLAKLSWTKASAQNKGKTTKKEEKELEATMRSLRFIIALDGIGGVILGWWLGTFTGRIPGY